MNGKSCINHILLHIIAFAFWFCCWQFSWMFWLNFLTAKSLPQPLHNSTPRCMTQLLYPTWTVNCWTNKCLNRLLIFQQNIWKHKSSPTSGTSIWTLTYGKQVHGDWNQRSIMSFNNAQDYTFDNDEMKTGQTQQSTNKIQNTLSLCNKFFLLWLGI